MSNTFKWAFIGDLQIPYEDPRAVTLWFKVMKWWKPDAIDFVGDIDDQLEYSSFSDGTTDEFFAQLKKEEDPSPLAFIKKNADGAKAFYTRVATEHPDADKHSSLGNHDIRIFKYIDKKAPAYNDQVTPNTLWALDDLGITWRPYSDKPSERHGGIFVHHGATTTASGLAVKSNIEEYDVSLVRGHDHRGGVVYKSYPLSGRTLQGMGCGHMCDPDAYGLQYTINPSWELGFGIAHVVDGRAHLQFVPITSDYTCVVDGRVFRG